MTKKIQLIEKKVVFLKKPFPAVCSKQGPLVTSAAQNMFRMIDSEEGNTNELLTMHQSASLSHLKSKQCDYFLLAHLCCKLKNSKTIFP